jgi:prolyl-tRNA editing enzyme YbaK/EbsC (Cys-tRNA(Pro) deacylase)
VRTLAEAAAPRGIEPAAVIKTIVVRRGEDDYLSQQLRRDLESAHITLRTRVRPLSSARAT